MAEEIAKTSEPEKDSATVPQLSAEDIVALVETGPRHPKSKWTSGLIIALCLIWSCYQLYIAYMPTNSFIARSWHLAFALSLCFLAFPAFKDHEIPFWVRGIRKIFPGFGAGRSIRDYIPLYDFLFAVVGAAVALFIWWDYDNIVLRQGLPETSDAVLGTILIVLLLEAARRALGPALSILAGLFLAYCFVGPWMPDFLKHRGIPLDFVVNDQYLSTTGIFGTPLGVSTSFVFLFVLFGAFLERAGAGKYFIDVAFAGLGHLKGGPAKAAVLASGLNGVVSGSSIANTVTTGLFTIPLMKKVGLPAHKAGAVEVAASTNGQLMPPVMGAAAFIMAEIIGIPYLDVVRAAVIPAVISYLALIYVVHLEAMKLDLPVIPKKELPPFLKTALGGMHYLIPVGVLIYFLVVARQSPIASCLYGIEALLVIILIQRPIIAWLAITKKKSAGQYDPVRDKGLMGAAVVGGFEDLWHGLINGARNMIAIGVATATAGIIVGAVTSTGLTGRFVNVIEVLSMGNVFLMLLLTAGTSIMLGMGLPTTANYIIMATLTAPVIVQLGADAGLVFPLIAAHLFVFYFGILADDTPPVGLAAYAAAALAKADPIKTGIQGFTYDMRTAILPFMFIFNLDLLMIDGVAENGDPIWITSWLHIGWIFFVSLAAMFAFAAALQGFFADFCSLLERVVLGLLCLALLRPSLVADLIGMHREMTQAVGLLIFVGLYLYQRARYSRNHPPKIQTA
ncbi:TRAP transporter permease [Magnetospira thiophila]